MRKSKRSKSKKVKRTSKRAYNVRRTAHGRKLSRKSTRKARKAKATKPQIDNGEAQAIQDFNNEEKLSGWKALLKTWTKGATARFKAQKYVNDLANRTKELQKKVVVSF